MRSWTLCALAWALLAACGGGGGGGDSAAAAFERGVEAQVEGELERAIASYDRALELDPEHEGAWVNRGVARLELGEFEAAIGDFTRAIELDAEDAGAYLGRGSAHRGERRSSEAVDDRSRAIELDPLDPRAHERRGDLWAMLEEDEAALVDYSNALRLAPDDPELYRARQLVHEHAGRDAEAEVDGVLAELAEGLAADPDDDELRFRRGLALFEVGEIELAQLDLDGVLERAPDHAAALLARGHTHAVLGDDALARDDYTASIASDAANAAPAHVARAALYVSIGAWEEATADFESALALDANDLEARERYAWLLATCPAATVRDGERAVELASGAGGWRRSDTLAAALAEAGRFDEAVEALEPAIEGAPDDLVPELRERLALYRARRPYRAD